MTNELTIRYNDQDLTAAEAIDLFYNIQQQKKMYDAADKKMRELLIKAMEETGTIELRNDDFCIRYIAPTEQERFDSKAFRADHADVYDEYVNFSPVKSSVRITPIKKDA